jgi:hypothetical protein
MSSPIALAPPRPAGLAVDAAVSAPAADTLRVAVRLLPLLLLYAIVFAASVRPTFTGDEDRYAEFATNLAHGYYSERGDVNLWNGPGYPLVVAPFAWLHLPWAAAKLLNVFFLFGATVYFCLTLGLYLPRPTALRFAYVLGLAPPFFIEVHLLLTESLATLLVCGFAYYFCKLSSSPERRLSRLVAAAAFLAWLALTKVIVGYVILALLVMSVAYAVLFRSLASRRFAAVNGLALVLCFPYLLYTYSLTGRVFYWANSGGSAFYWLTSPYAGELGDWHGYPKHIRSNVPVNPDHEAFFATVRPMSSVQQDDQLKRRGVEQIRHHPSKAFLNWLANLGRLLFSYPYSFTPQKLSTYFYLLPNMFIVVLSLLMIYPSAVRRSLIPGEIGWLMAFMGVAFLASSLVSAYERQFQILVPLLLLWLFFTLSRVVQIRLSPERG